MSDMERERYCTPFSLGYERGAMGQMLYTELNGSLLMKRSRDEKEREFRHKQNRGKMFVHPHNNRTVVQHKKKKRTHVSLWLYTENRRGECNKDQLWCNSETRQFCSTINWGSLVIIFIDRKILYFDDAIVTSLLNTICHRREICLHKFHWQWQWITNKCWFNFLFGILYFVCI